MNPEKVEQMGQEDHERMGNQLLHWEEMKRKVRTF
jgi:hypothetical protein